MKDPIDIVEGRVAGYDADTCELIVRVPYTDYATLIRRGYKECTVQFRDSRKLSDKQRKACYAMIGEIADWMGEEKSEVKELLKIEFVTNEMQQTADTMFSLSTASMSLVCAFQKYIARFIIRNGIPTKKPMLDYVDDVGDYVYACLNRKVCCVCGKEAGLCKAKLPDGEDGAEPLCGEHMEEFRRIGQDAFNNKYHLQSVKMDATVEKLYRNKASDNLKCKSSKRKENI